MNGCGLSFDMSTSFSPAGFGNADLNVPPDPNFIGPWGPRSGDRLLGIHLGSFKVSGFDMHRYSILQYLTVYDLICSLLYSPSLNDMSYKVYNIYICIYYFIMG